MAIKECVVCGGSFDALRGAKTCGKQCSKQRQYFLHAKWRNNNPEKAREHKRSWAEKDRAANPGKYEAVNKKKSETRRQNLDHHLELEARARARRGVKHAAASKAWREKYPDRAKRSRDVHNDKVQAAYQLIKQIEKEGLSALL